MNYNCPLCDKTYKRIDFFKEHMRLHLETYSVEDAAIVADRLLTIQNVDISNTSNKSLSHESITDPLQYNIPKLTQEDLDNNYMYTFFEYFNPKHITATPVQINKLFNIFANVYAIDPGNIGCSRVQSYVIKSLYKHYKNKLI